MLVDPVRRRPILLDDGSDPEPALDLDDQIVSIFALDVVFCCPAVRSARVLCSVGTQKLFSAGEGLIDRRYQSFMNHSL